MASNFIRKEVPEKISTTPLPEFKKCPNGFKRDINGNCIIPKSTRTFFSFEPTKKQIFDTKLTAPKPHLIYNIVLIRLKKDSNMKEYIVVPPPLEKTVIYILNKSNHKVERRVIEFPLNSALPEVHFINYKEGDNPVLPNGMDLESVLSSSAVFKTTDVNKVFEIDLHNENNLIPES